MSADLLSAFANVVTSVAAMSAAIAAVLGLNTWRKQKLFERDSDLARKLLVSLFVYKTALYSARTPIEHGFLRRKFWSMEMTSSNGRSSKIDDEVQNYRIDCEIHSYLFEQIERSLNDLKVLTFEAEALWGGGFSEKYFFLSRLSTRWRHSVEAYLRYFDPDCIDKEAAFLSFDQLRHDHIREYDGDDEFDRHLEETSKWAEEFLRTKLSGTKS